MTVLHGLVLRWPSINKHTARYTPRSSKACDIGNLLATAASVVARDRLVCTSFVSGRKQSCKNRMQFGVTIEQRENHAPRDRRSVKVLLTCSTLVSSKWSSAPSRHTQVLGGQPSLLVLDTIRSYPLHCACVRPALHNVYKDSKHVGFRHFEGRFPPTRPDLRLRFLFLEQHRRSCALRQL